MPAKMHWKTYLQANTRPRRTGEEFSTTHTVSAFPQRPQLIAGCCRSDGTLRWDSHCLQPLKQTASKRQPHHRQTVRLLAYWYYSVLCTKPDRNQKSNRRNSCEFRPTVDWRFDILQYASKEAARWLQMPQELHSPSSPASATLGDYCNDSQSAITPVHVIQMQRLWFACDIQRYIDLCLILFDLRLTSTVQQTT